MHQLTVDFWRQMLIPFGVVTTQCDIQRQNIFRFIGMYGLITNCRASRRQRNDAKRLAAFFRGTGKEVAFSGFEIFAVSQFCASVHAATGHFNSR